MVAVCSFIFHCCSPLQKPCRANNSNAYAPLPLSMFMCNTSAVRRSSAAENVSLGEMYLQNNVELSEAQIQDLLHLRRLFCGKIGQLGRARRSLLSQLPSESIGISHASDKLDQVTSLAEQLRANGSEEYRTYMQFASTFYRGVSATALHCVIVHRVWIMFNSVGSEVPDLLSLLQRFADSFIRYAETLSLAAALYMSPATCCDCFVLRATHKQHVGMLVVCCVVRA